MLKHILYMKECFTFKSLTMNLKTKRYFYFGWYYNTICFSNKSKKSSIVIMNIFDFFLDKINILILQKSVFYNLKYFSMQIYPLFKKKKKKILQIRRRIHFWELTQFLVS